MRLFRRPMHPGIVELIPHASAVTQAFAIISLVGNVNVPESDSAWPPPLHAINATNATEALI
jgi:hypothetical protein